MLRLHADFAIPIQAKPREVLWNRSGIFRAAAAGIDVFQSQQKLPARLTRVTPCEQRAERVAEVQVAGWTGGKSSDGGHEWSRVIGQPAGATKRLFAAPSGGQSRSRGRPRKDNGNAHTL